MFTFPRAMPSILYCRTSWTIFRQTTSAFCTSFVQLKQIVNIIFTTLRDGFKYNRVACFEDDVAPWHQQDTETVLLIVNCYLSGSDDILNQNAKRYEGVVVGKEDG